MKDFPLNLFSITPTLPLHKNHSFWLAIAAPIFVAILLLAGSFHNARSICFSSGCQNHFLESNKLPIGVLSLSVLFGVMVGRFHGSAQRIASHKQTEENNTFRNFYDHRKLFAEWMTESQNKKLGQLKCTSIYSATKLYHALFRVNSPTHLTTELSADHVEECFSKIVEDIKNNLNHFAICHSDQIQRPAPDSSIQLLEQLIKFSNTTCSKFGIEITSPAEWAGDCFHESEMIIITKEIAEILTHAFHFSSLATSIQLTLTDDFVRLAKSQSVESGMTSALYKDVT